MSSHPRVEYKEVSGATEVLTPDFLDFLAGLEDAMHDQVSAVRTARAERLRQALRNKARLGHSRPARPPLSRGRYRRCPRRLCCRGSRSPARLQSLP